jgi:hypothetical protein
MVALTHANPPAPFLDGSNFTGVIKNQTTQQAVTNFNISGDGTIGGNSAVTGNNTVAGSVSIGTATPGQKLTVAGGIVATAGELIGCRAPTCNGTATSAPAKRGCSTSGASGRAASTSAPPTP